MAAPAARSAVFREAEKKFVLVPPLTGVVTGWMEEEDQEEEIRRRRLLLERFMVSYGPGCPCVYSVQKVRSQPCFLYTLKVSVKKERVSWSHRSSRRFLPERRGHSIPVLLCRAGENDQLEQVVHRSGVAGEPDRLGVLSVINDSEYYLHELQRERNTLQKEGSSAPWTEVAVIRGTPGGRGITVISHIDHLVVRLHDLLFRLPAPAAAVDIRFSEHWFRLPAGWTEERLYAEDGFHFIDITVPVEKLVRKLYELSKQEEQEMERRRWETEEERMRRMQEEEETKRQEEEERMKILQRKKERREQVAAAAMEPRVPAAFSAGCRYSKFKLSMDSNKQVSCKCIEQEGLQSMLLLIDEGKFVIPILKAAPASGSASSKALQTMGYVEGYHDLRTGGLGMMRCRDMDMSGRTLSSVLMVSQSEAKILTIEVLVDELDIVLDDGMVMRGEFGAYIDIHCDDVSCSELLTADWIYHIVCKNIDGEGIISFSSLLVQLKKKLQLRQRKAGASGLYSTPTTDEEESDDLSQRFRKKNEWVPIKPKYELAEVELRDYSLLFPPSW